MAHEGQKRLNKIASMLRGNEYSMYGVFYTNIKQMRKYVKKHKLHYTDRMIKKYETRSCK